MPSAYGPSEALAVSSIQVEGLHGKFDYTIDFLTGAHTAGRQGDQLLTVNEDRLTLLYGRNGSGKTSLLRLLFHAIASSTGRNHRTELARTEFTRFVVTLTDGTFVSYAREEEPSIGPLRATLARPGREPVVWDVKPSEDGIVRPEDPQLILINGEGETEAPMFRQIDHEGAFHAALRDLNLNPIFLADSRGITGDVIDPADREQELRHMRRRRWGEESRRSADVEDAIELVARYLTGVAVAGAQAGSSRVDTVYLNVAKAISEHGQRQHSSTEILPELIHRVTDIGHRVDRLHHYGLLSAVPYERLSERLAETSEQNGELMQQVLGPYLEGLESRAEALEPGLAAVSSFVDALNSFLDGKGVEFHLIPDGIVIQDRQTGRRLHPGELSSGEKQIVLLFSDVVALQGETRLFIIDEPELSLNPEWQRQLMPQLLSVTEQSQMQLVVATHSIEILARYRDRIHSLERREY
jgi:energy-coupling factor transporter ATP-binding protein EcfA2